MSCVVVMGVSGSGKSTLARALAEELGWTFAEGDDLHPLANVAKLTHGIPLTDEDRWPWLAKVRAWIIEQEADAVVSCSALRRSYRDYLRAGPVDTTFCLIEVSEGVLAERLSRRRKHFMPASLLSSQLATLEPLEGDEPGFVVDGDQPREDVLAQVLRQLGERV